METSTLITIVYFSASVLLLFILALWVYHTGQHYEAKSFGKDVWAQRKIYAPIIVHFYDTATDIGVVYYFYTLMVEEQNGEYDYESLDMEVMFWLGLSFLVLYRVVMIGGLVLILVNSGPDKNTAWYDPFLVCLELYVFRTVYLSYRDAQDDIKKNAENRKRQKEMNASNQVTKEPGSTTTNIEVIEPETPKDTEIGMCEYQQMSLLAESVTESLPQIMLQSVFIIRSYNDPDLRDTQIELLMLSILASLLSISDKFCKFDERWGVEEEFKSADFRSFSKGLCFNMQSLWYAIRVIWRLCTITNNFAVYVLVWTVVGGAFLPIYAFVVFVLYTLMYKVVDGDDFFECLFVAVISMGAIMADSGKKIHYAKWCIVSTGLVLIAVFALSDFDCVICADAKQRHFANQDESGVTNYRISIFYVLGWVALFMEIPLYFMLKKKGVFQK